MTINFGQSSRQFTHQVYIIYSYTTQKASLSSTICLRGTKNLGHALTLKDIFSLSVSDVGLSAGVRIERGTKMWRFTVTLGFMLAPNTSAH